MTARLPAMARGARTSAVACGAVALAGLLSACAGYDGTNLARQACGYVDRSIALYHSSLSAPNAATADAEQTQALTQLREAMPIASTAAGEAGEYQGLMATLAESDHLPESLLVHALTLQCAAAQNGGEPVVGPVTTSETPATRPPPTGY